MDCSDNAVLRIETRGKQVKTSAWNPQTAPKQGGSDTTIVRCHPTAYVPTASFCASMHILGMVGKMA